MAGYFIVNGLVLDDTAMQMQINALAFHNKTICYAVAFILANSFMLQRN